MGQKELDDLAATLVMGKTPPEAQTELTVEEWAALVARINEVCWQAAFSSMYLRLMAMGRSPSEAAAGADACLRLVRLSLGYPGP